MQRLVLITPLAPAQPVPPVPPGGTPGSPVVTPHGGATQPAPYFAVVTYLESEGPGDGGGVPTPPIYLPPGVWPHPPGHPAHPLPPGSGLPTHPIFLPPGVWPQPPGSGGTPEHPIVLPPPIDAPPGTVWPPLDPPVAESGYIIAWVPGQGYRYVKVALGDKPSQKPPETAQPKRDRT